MLNCPDGLLVREVRDLQGQGTSARGDTGLLQRVDSFHCAPPGLSLYLLWHTALCSGMAGGWAAIPEIVFKKLSSVIFQ